MSELVTGEAVVLGLRPAKLASRGVAVAIDLAVWWGTYVVTSIGVASATASLDEAASAAIAVAFLLFLLIGLPVAVETLSRGRSLGKLVCGLRVVRDDGGPIRFRHALVRGAVAAVEIQLTMGTMACIASLVSARGRRVGDVFAGTLVVRERLPEQYKRQAPAPDWLVGQMQGIDLSGVGDQLWLAVRGYLSRMEELDPAVGWTMAQGLASDLVARTGKPVPDGASPTEYLAAVVAERQSRDAQRVFAGAQGLARPAVGGGSRQEAGLPQTERVDAEAVVRVRDGEPLGQRPFGAGGPGADSAVDEVDGEGARPAARSGWAAPGAVAAGASAAADAEGGAPLGRNAMGAAETGVGTSGSGYVSPLAPQVASLGSVPGGPSGSDPMPATTRGAANESGAGRTPQAFPAAPAEPTRAGFAPPA